jgi:hypothetical protein
MNNPQSDSTPRRGGIRRGVIVHRSGGKSEIFYQLLTGSREGTGTSLISPSTMFCMAIRRKTKLRTINCRNVCLLQYLQHRVREIIMKSIGELVCISLIVLSFAAILYSIPF